MNTPAVDIKDVLKDISSLGLTFAVDLFVGKEPSSPDDCVTIFDTPGGIPQLTFDKTEKYYYQSIQIRIRNNSYVEGNTLAYQIEEELQGMAHVTVNSTYYSLIQSMGSPCLLDWDKNNRARIIINFNIQRR